MAGNFEAEKNVNDLLEMFVYIKDNMVTKSELTDELTVLRTEIRTEIKESITQLREEVVGKIDGIHRALDAGYERDSALDARVSKIETVLHVER